jgi:hypothetical protein
LYGLRLCAGGRLIDSLAMDHRRRLRYSLQLTKTPEPRNRHEQ